MIVIHLFFNADEVYDNGPEDESVEKHYCFEASVAEECADNSEDKVESTDSGSVGIVGSDYFNVLFTVVQSWVNIAITDIIWCIFVIILGILQTYVVIRDWDIQICWRVEHLDCYFTKLIYVNLTTAFLLHCV